MFKSLLTLLCVAVVTRVYGGHVVINEIMYHPAEDHDELQYLELYNPTAAAVDLSNWKIDGGVKYAFPAKAALPAGGYLLIARDAEAVQRTYGTAFRVLGNFTGRLSHKGEKLQLLNGSGEVIEKVHFRDKAPWPLGGDGYGSSLERICADAPAEEGQNWAASDRTGKRSAGGSPGERNSVASAKPLPVIENIQWAKFPKPGEAVVVTADVRGPAPIDSVVLEYQAIRSPRQGATNELKMRQVSATNGMARYSAQIPGQAAGTLLRFTLDGKDKVGSERLEPGNGEPRPAFSAFVMNAPERAQIPLFTVVNSQALRGAAQKFRPSQSVAHGPGKSAVVYVPAQGEAGEVQLLDFVQVRRRAGGWKVHFLKDQRLGGMTGINVIFEGPPRWVLSEHLSYELYRKAGLKTEASGHVRLTMDGRTLGYYLFVEQPNKNYLARSGRDDTGNLYKVLWFGRGIVDQHEKKTNPNTGHDDIVNLIQTLRGKTGAAQWAYINEQFDVDAFVNYYAVNMCIENWDGFFNNHFVYHDLKPGGKWEIVPWDEDKTWGEYDGGPKDYSWYDMPLTTGMNGDRAQGGNWFGGGGPFGGGGWWRPAGFLSGPLLANPQFRQKLEARLRELCATAFTPEQFGPVVQALQQRLRPEVELKARLANQDPAWALRQFDGDIASFQRQLVNRRKFILAAVAK